MNEIRTDKAPGAIGPYSQGIVAGEFIYTSGQLPIDREGNLISDCIKKATRASIENVRAILESAGSNLDKVVKVTIFIKDMDNFSDMNEAYAEYFSEHKPARSCVEVARLPKDAIVEIEAVATR